MFIVFIDFENLLIILYLNRRVSYIYVYENPKISKMFFPFPFSFLSIFILFVQLLLVQIPKIA